MRVFLFEYITGGGLDPVTGQGKAAVHWHQAAGAAEVEVDLETGRVQVIGYEAAVYALNDPTVKQNLDTFGSDPGGQKPAEFTAFVANQVKAFQAPVKASGAKL